MVNNPPIPKEWNGKANKNKYGFPGTIKNQSIMYPMIEMLCEMMKARFLPNVFDILATIGILANIVAAMCALVGLMSFALATGLFFARFSRPTAKVRFSENALIAPYTPGSCAIRC